MLDYFTLPLGKKNGTNIQTVKIRNSFYSSEIQVDDNIKNMSCL